MLSDLAVAYLRTYVPIIWGAVAAYLATRLGVVVDEASSAGVIAVATSVCGAVVYATGRAVARRVPWLSGLLLGSTRQPTYRPPAATGRVSSYRVD
ncbi:MAG: hypothetical protein L0Y54_17625 [Sporichthyaceae bacterium]|nr:hypothetical protein [Sporichthyaceae bacterium]